MVEPLLSGIVLGMITVTAMGLFVAAFLQYRRGSQFDVYVIIFQYSFWIHGSLKFRKILRCEF